MPELTDHQTLRDRIRAESQQYLSTEPREGEFTTSDYKEWLGVDNNTAYRVLQQMVKDGKLTKRNGKQNGANCNVYHAKSI